MKESINTIDIIEKVNEIKETKSGLDKMFLYFLDKMFLRAKNIKTGKISGISYEIIGDKGVFLTLTYDLEAKTVGDYLKVLWWQSEANILGESKSEDLIKKEIVINYNDDSDSNSCINSIVKDIEVSEEAITLVY